MMTTMLADGTEVFCLNRSETLVLDQHVHGYLEHGIEIHDGDIVLDVGANIGLFGIHAVQRFPAVRVLAFEPVPDIYQVLKQNAGRFGAGRLVALPLGVAGEPGRTRFTFFPNSPALSTSHPELWDRDGASLVRAVKGNIRAARKALWYARWVPGFLSGWIAKELQRGAKTVECELTTISQVIGEHDLPRIDLLKVDCEGAELSVLQGIENVHWPRIRQVVVEVHDIEGRLERVSDILTRHGLTRITAAKEDGFEDTPLINVYASRTTE
jgi:FkbM family methyltransferase